MDRPLTGFFFLPGEARNRIYAMVLTAEFQIPIVPPNQQINLSYDCLTARYGPRNSYSKTPSHNALSLTCRQAYNESIHVYYEENHFETYTGQAFQDYVDGVPKERLQMIRVLSLRVQRKTNGLDTSPPLRGRYMCPGSCRWILENPHLLQPFQSLKVVQLQGSFRVSWHASPAVKARLIESLVRLFSRRLPQLIQICIHTLVPRAYMPDYDNFHLRVQDTPGWDYHVRTFGSLSGKSLPEGLDFNVIEYMTHEDASVSEFQRL